MATPEHFARIEGRVELRRLLASRVVVVGVGAVGSRVADELTRSGIGSLLLIDGDTLDAANIVRHVLGEEYVGRNKAEGLASWLPLAIPSVHVDYVSEAITDEIPDERLDELLVNADLIVAATDNRQAQRRISRRALSLDIPAIFPGIDEAGQRGEIFVSLGNGRSPCYECWDLFREVGAALRGVQALNVDIYPTVDTTVRLCLGLLDPSSEFTDLLRGVRGDERPRTLFFVSRPGADGGIFSEGRTFRRAIPDFRENCPGCGGVPANPRRAAARLRVPWTLWLARRFPPGPLRWVAVLEIVLFVLGVFIPDAIIWAAFASLGLVVVTALVAGPRVIGEG